MVEKGIVNNETQANTILVLCASIFFILAGWLFYNANTPPPVRYNFPKSVIERLPSEVQQKIERANLK